MDNDSVCPHCLSSEHLGDVSSGFDINCFQCGKRFCGECWLPTHYPASCGERLLWDNHGWIEIARNRVETAEQVWNQLDEYLDYVFADAEMDLDGQRRFQRHAISRAINFAKWLRVHCITHMLLNLRLDLHQTRLLTRILCASRYLPNPLNLLNIRIAHLISLILDINDSLPFLRRAPDVVGLSAYDAFRTDEEIENELIAVRLTSSWWSNLLGISLQ